MTETTLFCDNFISALRMLGGTPGGGSLELRRGVGAFATGIPFAGENYALFDSASSQKEVTEVLDFFKDRNLPFVSLQLPELKIGVSEELERKGLTLSAEYLAMSIKTPSSEKKQAPCVKIASDRLETEKWAEAVWTGFEGKLPVPKNYKNFVEYLKSCPDNQLYFLEKNGVPLCSAMLHSTEKTCGLYYFATRPEARRRGFAAKFMDSLRVTASHHSESLVLLATEMGAKMYKNYGFEELLRVSILSGSQNI